MLSYPAGGSPRATQRKRRLSYLGKFRDVVTRYVAARDARSKCQWALFGVFLPNDLMRQPEMRCAFLLDDRRQTTATRPDAVGCLPDARYEKDFIAYLLYHRGLLQAHGLRDAP